MTGATRMNGLIGDAICTGCRVPGFGEHSCVGEGVKTDATGQAVVDKCACQVEATCAGHRPLPRYAMPS